MRFYATLAGLVTLLLLSGCINVRPETRYYTLPIAVADGDGKPATGLVLGLGPLEVPELIDRREIVVRKDDSEVELLLFDLWGGSAKQEIRNTLAKNLAARIGSDQLVFFPFRGKAVEVQLRLEFLEMIGERGGAAELDVLWSISPPGKRAELERGRYQVAVAGDSVKAVVEAYARLLGLLADDIAARLRAGAGEK